MFDAVRNNSVSLDREVLAVADSTACARRGRTGGATWITGITVVTLEVEALRSFTNTGARLLENVLLMLVVERTSEAFCIAEVRAGVASRVAVFAVSSIRVVELPRRSADHRTLEIYETSFNCSLLVACFAT